MVKGLSRKVIIVKSPDPKIFEQAIFIVRDEYLMSRGVDQKELLRQARQAANGYVQQTYGWRLKKPLKYLLYGTISLTAIAITAAAAYFFF